MWCAPSMRSSSPRPHVWRHRSAWSMRTNSSMSPVKSPMNPNRPSSAATWPKLTWPTRLVPLMSSSPLNCATVRRPWEVTWSWPTWWPATDSWRTPPSVLRSTRSVRRSTWRFVTSSDDVIVWKCMTGPLWGESTDDRWIPLTKCQSFWYIICC